MSEWNYTECAKPFETEAAAREYMVSRDFAGWILKREIGYTAVCPTYPDGFYPEAIVVAEIENSTGCLTQTKKQKCC